MLFLRSKNLWFILLFYFLNSFSMSMCAEAEMELYGINIYPIAERGANDFSYYFISNDYISKIKKDLEDNIKINVHSFFKDEVPNKNFVLKIKQLTLKELKEVLNDLIKKNNDELKKRFSNVINFERIYKNLEGEDAQQSLGYFLKKIDKQMIGTVTVNTLFEIIAYQIDLIKLVLNDLPLAFTESFFDINNTKAETVEKRLKSLWLNQISDLKTIPEGIFKFKNVADLKITNCKNLIAIPEEIGKMDLRLLDLRGSGNPQNKIHIPVSLNKENLLIMGDNWFFVNKKGIKLKNMTTEKQKQLIPIYKIIKDLEDIGKLNLYKDKIKERYSLSDIEKELKKFNEHAEQIKQISPKTLNTHLGSTIENGKYSLERFILAAEGRLNKLKKEKEESAIAENLVDAFLKESSKEQTLQAIQSLYETHAFIDLVKNKKHPFWQTEKAKKIEKIKLEAEKKELENLVQTKKETLLSRIDDLTSDKFLKEMTLYQMQILFKRMDNILEELNEFASTHKKMFPEKEKDEGRKRLDEKRLRQKQRLKDLSLK